MLNFDECYYFQNTLKLNQLHYVQVVDGLTFIWSCDAWFKLVQIDVITRFLNRVNLFLPFIMKQFLKYIKSKSIANIFQTNSNDNNCQKCKFKKFWMFEELLKNKCTH